MNEIIAIDVADWLADEEHPYFPEGSRDKQLLRCSDPTPHALLIAHHRYQFKQSRRIYPEQFWAEVVAYRIGLLANVSVPPTYPAWNSQTGICAALIEWFYGYADRPNEGFLSGGLFMKAMISNYDVRRGRQHNFRHIERLCTTWAGTGEQSPGNLQPDWIDAWARMLTFDALIGNTDRHHENWGFIIDRAHPSTGPNVRLAPTFDNGTSLGHERPNNQFKRFDDSNYLVWYIGRGKHHLRWQLQDDAQAGHCELLLKLMSKHPDCRRHMLAVLDFDPNILERELNELTTLPVPVPLSPERARFMLRLTLARRDQLAKALNS
jgi:hypothetical protein